MYLGLQNRPCSTYLRWLDRVLQAVFVNYWGGAAGWPDPAGAAKVTKIIIDAILNRACFLILHDKFHRHTQRDFMTIVLSNVYGMKCAKLFLMFFTQSYQNSIDKILLKNPPVEAVCRKLFFRVSEALFSNFWIFHGLKKKRNSKWK